MKRILGLFVGTFLLLSTLSVRAQIDNEFWFCVPQLTAQHETDEPKLFITNAGDVTANVKIEMPRNTTDFPTINIQVAPGEQNCFNFKNFFSDVNQKEDNYNIIESGLAIGVTSQGMVKYESCTPTNKGIHITSDNLITAYLQRGNTNNCDIWALKGKNAFGTYFIVPSEEVGNCNEYHSSRMKAESQNKPGAWNAIDIVAVEECKVTVILQEAGLVTNWPNSEKTATFNLERGQTLNLQAVQQVAFDNNNNPTYKKKNLIGTQIKSTGRIAVQWKDDSLLAKWVNESGGEKGTSWDVVGDQLVPVELAGKEYIVMRGQLGDDYTNGQNKSNRMYENVYFMSTEEGPTTIDFKTDAGDVITSQTLSGIGTWGKLLLNKYNITKSSNDKNYDAVYIKADKPIIVWHISGSSGAEIGGAILPTINGCTGSDDVSICSSTTRSFDLWLNIMCKKAHIGDFILTYEGKEYYLSANWFKEIPNTNWCYLGREYMNFSKGTNGIIPAIKPGTVVSIRNTTGLFHLAVINGNNSGSCQYGYFSAYSPSTGRAVIIDDEFESEYTHFCYGDTITLEASGGLSYNWKYFERDELGNEFTSDKTFVNQDQMTSYRPKVVPNQGWNQYQVTIQRRCYLNNNPDTTIDVWAIGYPRAKSDFTIETLTDCSPAKIVVTNQTNENGYQFEYRWSLEGGDLETPVKSTKKNYGADTLTFTNTTDAKHSYNLTLETSLGSNCPDKSEPKKFYVKPAIIAKINADVVSGCTPLSVEFENASVGPYTRMFVDFGDGGGWSEFSTTTQTFNHTYNNPTINDTVYMAKLMVWDDVNGSCESVDTVDIRVFGMIISQFTIDNTSGCSPLTTRIENTYIGEHLIHYVWEFDTPEEGNTQYYEPSTIECVNNSTTPQQHKIRLKTTRTNINGTTCESVSPWSTVTVFPEFKVDYTVLPLNLCDSTEATFVNTSSDLSATFHWNTGYGTMESNDNTFSQFYYNVNPYEVKYETSLVGESEYGCRDSVSNGTITVMPYLDPRFNIEDETKDCSSLYVKVENTTPSPYMQKQSWDINCQSCNYEVVDGTLDNVALLNFNKNGDGAQNITIRLTDSYKNCQMTYSRIIDFNPSKNHVEGMLVSDNYKAPTCTLVGSVDSVIYCTICHEELNRETIIIPSYGHTDVVDTAVSATCTKSGKTEGKHCSVCGEVLVAQQTVPAKGHTEVIDTAVAATCTESGKTEGKHCSVCGEVLVAQKNISAKGHSEVKDEAVAATYTSTGLTEGSHCSVCGAVLVAQELLPVLNNNGSTQEEDLPINYVTISSNGAEVAQVIVPTEEYGKCEVLWTTIPGLTCEGQVISSNKFAIATFVNGDWQQNKHENWESPTTDSGGMSLSGTGEMGSTYYNFRYSIGMYTPDFGAGVMQNSTCLKYVTISRTDNNANTHCGIYDHYFDFDFDDGAWFQISFDGEILYTSELNPIDKYHETNGVNIKNFMCSDSKIEFDLIDGEYSETKYAHYVVDLNAEWDFGGGVTQSGMCLKNVSILRTDNNISTHCAIYNNYFDFDFNDGAWFQISFDGVILYTSECVPMDRYSDTYGVSIKNFVRNDSIIEFDLIDGEYSETKFAHYVVDLFDEGVTILRTDNNATTYCDIYDTYFSFDFDDGALFQISYDGQIMYTSELNPISEYSDTYGVSIKNFKRTDSKIEFDLLDGEYSGTKYAHYVIDLLANSNVASNNNDHNSNTETNNNEDSNNNNGNSNNGGTNNGGTNNGNGNQGGNNGGTNNGGHNNGNGNQGGSNGGTNNGGSDSGHKPIVPVTDPVSAIINQINSVFNMIYDLTTDVEEEAVNEVHIYAFGNTIVVENADAEIFVYDAMGRLVCRNDEKLVRTELQINGTGVYIVKVSNVAKRVMIN